MIVVVLFDLFHRINTIDSNSDLKRISKYSMRNRYPATADYIVRDNFFIILSILRHHSIKKLDLRVLSEDCQEASMIIENWCVPMIDPIQQVCLDFYHLLTAEFQ
jgi:hypothetical protein